MEELIEILRKADTDAGNRVAKASKSVDALCTGFLEPIAARLHELGGPEHESIAGLTSKTKPQYIAELRLVVPEVDQLQARLRIALEKRTAKSETPREVYDYYSGVSLVQRWDGLHGEFPAHIRWGFWTTAAKAKERIVPPYRHLCKSLDWENIDERIMSVPVVNLKTTWISLVGGHINIGDIADAAQLGGLKETIAQEMFLISSKVWKPA